MWQRSPGVVLAEFARVALARASLVWDLAVVAFLICGGSLVAFAWVGFLRACVFLPCQAAAAWPCPSSPLLVGRVLSTGWSLNGVRGFCRSYAMGA